MLFFKICALLYIQQNNTFLKDVILYMVYRQTEMSLYNVIIATLKINLIITVIGSFLKAHKFNVKNDIAMTLTTRDKKHTCVSGKKHFGKA